MRAGRIAAGVRDFPRGTDLVGLVRRQFRKAVGPVGRDAKRGRGIQHLRRRGAHAVDQLDRLLGGVIRQAEDDEIDFRHQRLLGFRILALLVGDARRPSTSFCMAEPLGNAEARGAGAAVNEHDRLLSTAGVSAFGSLVSETVMSRSFQRKSLNCVVCSESLRPRRAHQVRDRARTGVGLRGQRFASARYSRRPTCAGSA